MNYFKSIIALFIIAITLNSCSSDDDSSNDVDTNLIVGEWAMNSHITESLFETSFLGQSTSTAGETVGSDFDYTVTFNEDGTLTADGSYTATTSTTVDGEPFQDQTTVISDISTTGTWSISGNEITLTGFTNAQVNTGDLVNEGATESVSIITALNDTSLTIEADLGDLGLDESIDGGGLEGVDFEISGTTSSSFTRVN